MNERAKCVALWPKGKPCRYFAVSGGNYCPNHANVWDRRACTAATCRCHNKLNPLNCSRCECRVGDRTEMERQR